MGYPMAANLRSKIGLEYTLLVCDVSEAVIEKFRTEMDGKGPVEVIRNGYEAVKRAVCPSKLPHR